MRDCIYNFHSKECLINNLIITKFKIRDIVQYVNNMISIIFLFVVSNNSVLSFYEFFFFE